MYLLAIQYVIDMYVSKVTECKLKCNMIVSIIGPFSDKHIQYNLSLVAYACLDTCCSHFLTVIVGVALPF